MRTVSTSVPEARYLTEPGLVPVEERLPRTAAVIAEQAGRGLHPGAQGYVSLAGSPVASFGYGLARPDRAMTPDTLLIWMSSTKPITVVALAQLWEEGLFDLDDRVTRFIPEFGEAGKAAITLRQVLTHTAGFRMADVRWGHDDWPTILAKICHAPLESGWVPGRRAGYHMATSWFVLGEVVQRLTNEPFGERVRREIFLPLGMRDSWMGMPGEAYDAYGDRIGWMFDTSKDANGSPHPFSHRERVARCSPSAGGWGPVRELVAFYEMLLARGARGDARVLSPVAVEALTAPHRVGMHDETFRHPLDWGLGVIVNTAPRIEKLTPYGFGNHASPRAFGHGGWQSSVGMADPEHGLAVGLVFNGTPGDGRHTRRVRDVMTALYEDLGLAAAHQA
jgi:CubicO group peptidase (beta-lactamase class C family)